MKIEGRPTGERRIRLGIVIIMVLGFGLYSLYDGYYGYPMHNMEKLVENLDPTPRELPKPSPLVTERAIRKFKKGDLVEDVKRSLGAPAQETESSLWYFGPGAGVEFRIAGPFVSSKQTLEVNHDETSLLWQKGMGYPLTALSVFLILKWIGAARVRVTLDDEGLRFNRRPLIPYDAMKEIKAENYRRKGWLDLIYEREGREDLVRLNDYHFTNFKEIVTQICERKGFPTPFKTSKATAASSDAAADSGSKKQGDDAQVRVDTQVRVDVRVDAIDTGSERHPGDAQA